MTSNPEQRGEAKPSAFDNLPGNNGLPLLRDIESGQIDSTHVRMAAQALRSKTVQDFGGIYNEDKTVFSKGLPTTEADSVLFLLDAVDEITDLIDSIAAGDLTLKSEQ